MREAQPEVRPATSDRDLEPPVEPEPEPQPPTAAQLPPDPAAYDSPRAVQARARGLSAPYIPGGEDPDLETTRLQERRYVRLLVAMIVVVVLAGFVLGVLAKLLGLPG